MRHKSGIAVLVFALFGLCPSAFAASFSFMTIDVTFSGACCTAASGINKSGQIVGSYLDGSLVSHGFLDDGGVFTTVDVPGAITTSLRGINDRGQIVGTYTDGSGSHGFLTFKKKFATIDFPAAVSTFANGINKRGQIVGSYDGFHGFLRSPGGGFSIIEVPFSGHLCSGVMANGIDTDGAIVGQTLCSDYPVGFLDDDNMGTIIDPTQGGAFRIASAGAIGSGVIVGTYVDAVPVPHTSHGYVRYPSGGVTELKLPDGTPAFPGGINSEGQIVGSYPDSSGGHGFLALPQ